MTSRRSFLAAAAGLACTAQESTVRFAVTADVQYADRDTNGRRMYRASLEKLKAAVQLLAAERPAFTVHLGDLVDGGVENFDRIEPVFDELPGKRYHVLGNHDFFGTREQVLEKFGMERSFYSFSVASWRFIVLDGMQVSLRDGGEAVRMLEELRNSKAPNAVEWNGAVGEEQRAWLVRELKAAESGKQRSIVFCHFPTVAQACRPNHLLWDHAEVLRTLEASPSVVAYMNGHDHNGGYAERNGIHHVTVAGLVENDVMRSVQVCEASAQRLVMRSPGERVGKVLAVRA